MTEFAGNKGHGKWETHGTYDHWYFNSMVCENEKDQSIQ